MKREKDEFDDRGLVRIGHSLGYGRKHGRLRWLPKWGQSIIVRVWNNVTCEIFGHHILDYRTFKEKFRPSEPERIVCTMCCKEFTPEQYDKLSKKKTW